MMCMMTKTLFGKVAMQMNLIPDKKKEAKEAKEAEMA